MYNVTTMEVTKIQVCQDILSLLTHFKQELSRFAESHRLTTMQVAALYSVAQHGELPMGKVAGVLHCDPSNVTGIIDRLVTHKLVTRTECPEDRRAKTISLTAEGHKTIDELMQLLPDQLGCDKLTTAERSALHSAVQKLLAV